MLLVLIIGASISSGYSGTPSGELVANRLNLPVQNEARVAQGLTRYVDKLVIKDNTLVINLDGSYWDSYNRDCTGAVKAVKTLYTKTNNSYVVMATVPNRQAEGFYHFIAGTETNIQGCREDINKEIITGCKTNCLLLDADELYKGREESDIHLTPSDWKKVADHIMEKLYVNEAL